MLSSAPTHFRKKREYTHTYICWFPFVVFAGTSVLFVFVLLHYVLHLVFALPLYQWLQKYFKYCPVVLPVKRGRFIPNLLPISFFTLGVRLARSTRSPTHYIAGDIKLMAKHCCCWEREGRKNVMAALAEVRNHRPVNWKFAIASALFATGEVHLSHCIRIGVWYNGCWLHQPPSPSCRLPLKTKCRQNGRHSSYPAKWNSLNQQSSCSYPDWQANLTNYRGLKAPGSVKTHLSFP